MHYTSSYDRYGVTQSTCSLAQTTLCTALCHETYELVVQMSVRM
jgi:hypothetical protein